MVASFFLGILAPPSVAEVTFYTDEAAWRTAWETTVGASPATVEFDTISANVGLADESIPNPPPDTEYPNGLLTWRRANSGLCLNFQVLAAQPGADIVFDENAPGGVNIPGFDDALSIGDGDNYEDDDFFVFYHGGAPMFAAGFDLVNNVVEGGEQLEVNTVTETAVYTAIPDSAVGRAFIGFVADAPIRWAFFNEGAGGDDIAVGRLQFADPSQYAADFDRDGLDDCAEATVHGTSARVADTDGDGLVDGVEIALGLDPFDADENSNSVFDGFDDLDGDGLGNLAEFAAGTDVAQSDTDGDGLSDGLEMGAGDANFVSRLPFACLGAGDVVRGADTDGDGDLDVVCTHGDEINHLRNVGSAGLYIFESTMRDSSDLFPADLDGDGNLDLLSASALGNKIHWFRSNGARLFDDERDITTSALGATSIFAADLDQDGDLDVLSAAALDNKIDWYRNDGVGNFTDETDIATTATGATAVHAADLDEDGDVDVLAGFDNGICWYPNDGVGGFGSATCLDNDSDIDVVRMVDAADLDGDGDLDVVAAISGAIEAIRWFRNDGAGNFSAQPAVTTNQVDLRSADVADLDADGDLDVVAAFAAQNKIDWYQNDGAGNFTDGTDISTTTTSARSVFAGDLDGDGGLDVLVGADVTGNSGWFERVKLTDPISADTDGDGLCDGPQTVESACSAGEDINANGIVDTGETSPSNLDTDGDYINDFIETFSASGSNPADPDSDDDGLCDGNRAVAGVCVFGEDINANGVVDLGETNPVSADSDLDGIADDVETFSASGISPTEPDTDGDGLCDGAVAVSPSCVAGEDFNANGVVDLGETNPASADSDLDGIADDVETFSASGISPTEPDTDGDGLCDGAVAVSPSCVAGEDFNANGVVDLGETNPASVDTDLDGISDGVEVLSSTATDPLNPDSDGDTLCDGSLSVEGVCDTGEDLDNDGQVDPGESNPLATDSDLDGLADAVEISLGTDPLLADSDGDGVDDPNEIANGTDPTMAGDVGVYTFTSFEEFPSYYQQTGAIPGVTLPLSAAYIDENAVETLTGRTVAPGTLAVSGSTLLTNLFGDFYADPGIRLIFHPPIQFFRVHTIGAAGNTQAETILLEYFDGQTSLGVETSDPMAIGPSQLPEGVFEVSSASPINVVILSTPSGEAASFLLDDMSFITVPEPGSDALLVAALLLFALAHKRIRGTVR